LEAASLAAHAEEKAREEDAHVRPAAETEAVENEKDSESNPLVDPMVDRIQSLVPRWLPEVGAVYVANAMVAHERLKLKALWKAHRAKFLQDGHLGRAVGAAAVLHALETLPLEDLVAAFVVTDASDYLVWLDMGNAAMVAAFPNARAYFANP
jgi:hypothetical protein